MPVFAWSASQSKIAMPVTSLPVPDVVGHATCGASGPGIGARVAERRVDVRCAAARGGSRAGSPPCRCRSPSRRRARRSRRRARRARTAPRRRTTRRSARSRRASNTAASTPAAASDCADSSANHGSARSVRSVNSAARRMPSARARSPTSASAPRPNVTRDASTVNAVSHPAAIASSWGARHPRSDTVSRSGPPWNQVLDRDASIACWRTMIAPRGARGVNRPRAVGSHPERRGAKVGRPWRSQPTSASSSRSRARR